MVCDFGDGRQSMLWGLPREDLEQRFAQVGVVPDPKGTQTLYVMGWWSSERSPVWDAKGSAVPDRTEYVCMLGDNCSSV